MISVSEEGRHVIKNDDDDLETLNMSNKRWRLSDSVHVSLETFSKLKSVVADVLRKMFTAVGCKFFSFPHGHVFLLYAVFKNYEQQEEELLKHAKLVLIDKVYDKANFISSHTAYKINVDENDVLCLKECIPSHDVEKLMDFELSSDCATSHLLGFRTILTMSAARNVRASIKAAIFKTIQASSDVYVCPHRETKDLLHYWLFFAAAMALLS